MSAIMSQKRSTASALFATLSDPYNPALAAGFFLLSQPVRLFLRVLRAKMLPLMRPTNASRLAIILCAAKKKPRQSAGQCPSGIIGGVGGRGKRPRHLYYRPPPANSLIIFKEFFANFRIRLRFFLRPVLGFLSLSRKSSSGIPRTNRPFF